ncbi:glycosyltransferase family 2 protein [Phormidesmis sp. 146-33]
MTQTVRVSIGIPVYNGENYLEAAIESFLAQTFSDFELIISDNASSDRTQEICREYMTKDARIRYHRNETNIGAARNYNGLVALASGEYFKWAAHDDMCAPTYLEKCVEVLDRHPDIINCYPWTQFVDAKGDPDARHYDYDGKLRLNSEKPHERFHDIVCTHQECFPIFGVMRISALRSIPLHGSYGHADGVLLARLALLGRYYELPEYLFLSRQHAEQSCKLFAKQNSDQDYFGYTVWFDPAKSGKFMLPRWTLFIEYCRSILQAPVSSAEKMACLGHMREWLNCYWKHMVRDVLSATSQLLQVWKSGSSPPSPPKPSQVNG